MVIYRDYGAVNNNPFPNNEFTYVKRGQVWQATHDGAGNRLPHRYRSFISFSFGDKWIEDFDLIAYCKGDTMSRSGSANFEDLASRYDIMDGQYYHGTHYQPNTLSLDLVSDGIDQQKLENFLHWFAGGKTRELVLAEHPNRAIMARVANPPEIDMTPFEKPITISLGGLDYQTSTTVYRGTISLKFVSDMPFWYAKQNVLIYNSTKNLGLFSGISLAPENDIFKEAIKVVYEDNVPMNSMAQSTMHFGGDQFAIVDNEIKYSLTATYIISDGGKPSNWDSELSTKPGYFIYDGKYWVGAAIDGTVGGVTYLGRIAGAAMANEGGELSEPIASSDESYQLFYGGTAPSPTIISFKVNLEPHPNDHYITCFGSEYSNGADYSSIEITSVHTKRFDFSLPNVLTSWNKAWKTFVAIKTGSNGTNWSDLADTIRDQIRHPAVRAFAISIINYVEYLNRTTKDTNNPLTYLTDAGIFTSEGKTAAKDMLEKFFKDRNGNYSDATFEFDAEQGRAIGTFKYWQASADDVNIASIIYGEPTSSQETANFIEHTEDVGDMLRSNWLFLEDRNELVDNQYVSAWTAASPQNAHKVKHNARNELMNLTIKYKNMYL